MELEDGQVYEVDYPFVRCIVSLWDEEGCHETNSWRPGVDYRLVCPDDAEAIANGIGKQVLTVISTHKPGRYPERVFYTRKWISPNKHEFGKRRLMIATKEKFRRLVSGYAHEYVLDDELTDSDE